MAIFGKLFGRKKDDLELEKPSYRPMAPDQMGLPELSTPTIPGTPPELGPEFAEPGVSPLRTYEPRTYAPPQHAQPGMPSRDVELILSKLDAIRSVLTNVEIRIGRLEKAAGIGEKDEKGYRW